MLSWCKNKKKGEEERKKTVKLSGSGPELPSKFNLKTCIKSINIEISAFWTTFVCVCVLLDDVKIVFFTSTIDIEPFGWNETKKKKYSARRLDTKTQWYYIFYASEELTHHDLFRCFGIDKSKSNRKIRCFVGCHAKIARFHVQIS